MIKSFKHKGLKKYFLESDLSGICPIHADRLTNLLTAIDSANIINDLNFPGFYLHRLKGNRQNVWSVKVNGNWRLTFEFRNTDAYILDYEDYH